MGKNWVTKILGNMILAQEQLKIGWLGTVSKKIANLISCQQFLKSKLHYILKSREYNICNKVINKGKI
jgi:hypothetical protein